MKKQLIKRVVSKRINGLVSLQACRLGKLGAGLEALSLRTITTVFVDAED